MPARINKIRHDENTRDKIQCGNIINRLQKLVFGEIDMPPHAVSAALGLLRKKLPDMASVEHSGEISTTNVIRAPAVVDDTQDWANQHVPEQHRTH